MTEQIAKKPNLFAFPYKEVEGGFAYWVQLLKDIKGGNNYRRFEAKTNIETGRNKRGAIGLFFSSNGGQRTRENNASGRFYNLWCGFAKL